MKDLLKEGRVLGRSEMKKIMAGSGGSCISWAGCSGGKRCLKWNGSNWECSNCCVA